MRRKNRGGINERNYGRASCPNRKLQTSGRELCQTQSGSETLANHGQGKQCGNVTLALEQFTANRGDLVRTDPNWRKWGFMQLFEVLKQWLERNTPVNVICEESQYHEKEVNPRKVFQSRDHKP